MGDKRLVSFSVDAIFVRGPIRVLKDAINQGRFLEGVVLSVMYFERFGVDRLKGYFKERSVPLKPLNLDRRKVGIIMKLLEGFDIIDHGTHSLMGEVNTVRNKIVHELRHPDAIDREEAKRTIEKAIKCLEKLGVT